MHKGLNSTQRRSFSRKIIDIPGEDLLNSLGEQKVIEIRKLSRKEDEKYIPTGVAIVTFDLIRRQELCNVCGFTPPHAQCTKKFCVNCNNETHTSFDALSHLFET